MYYSPTTYVSHPRRSRVSRQAVSYRAQDTPPSTQPPTKVDSQRGRKYTAASVGRSNKISHHLFLLISKFEALDALSHGIDVPSLLPAPLQISRNSSPQRDGTDGPASTQFDSIFSPRRRGQSRYEDMLTENMTTSVPEDIFTPGTIKKSGSGKLKQARSPYKVNNIRLRKETQQSSLGVGTSVRGHTDEPRHKAKEARERSIVQDRIKFYGGCIEHISLPGPCPNLLGSNSAHGSPFPATTAPDTNARPSLRHIASPTTPKIHDPRCHRSNGAQPPPGPLMKGGWQGKTISTKGGNPHTPTKTELMYGAKRRKTLGQTFANPFLQAPHTNPPTRHVSPKTTLTSRKPDKQGMLSRRLFAVIQAPDSLKKDALPPEKRGRPVLQEPQTKPTNTGDFEKNAPHFPGALYRTKSLERPAHTVIGQKGSKDKDMKMLREKGVVAKSFESGPWSFSKAAGTKLPRPKWRDFSNTTPSAKAPQRYTPAILKSTGSTKPASKLRQMNRTRHPNLIWRENGCPSTPAKGSCRDIHDKIKRWESGADSRGQAGEEQNACSPPGNAGNLLPYRKSIFENPWNEEVGQELVKRGLDCQEVQAVVDEFQDIGMGIDDDASKGRWKMIVAPKLGKGGLTAQQHGCTDESGDMDMRIIVREAQCGLEEPKPLRLLEMKRMILLCREKPPVYRGRGSVCIK